MHEWRDQEEPAKKGKTENQEEKRNTKLWKAKENQSLKENRVTNFVKCYKFCYKVRTKN